MINKLKVGDLVRWTFGKTSMSFNPEGRSYVGILLEARVIPENSWYVYLSDGSTIHADISELEIVSEIR